jgi:hypothetical protein
MTNREALEHLWKSVDKSSIYQLSYIRNLAFELGEKELYFIFKEVPVEGYQPAITVEGTEWYLNGVDISKKLTDKESYTLDLAEYIRISSIMDLDRLNGSSPKPRALTIPNRD